VRTITVHLGSRTYPVHVGAGLLGEVGRECARLGLGRKVAVVSQRGIASHARTVLASLQGAGFTPALVEVAEGEAAKSIEQAGALWEAFLGHGLDRGSGVVAVGGGVVGDLAGFAAAGYMRGVGLVQVPTSLLAQVDASVGGKVAVNHPRAKNLIGAFHQPRLVVIDPGTLSTLPEREYRSGLAEVIKTGAALDAELFTTLEASVPAIRGRDAELLERVIAICCAEKATIVEQDEREESGLRMVLNYGHTVGHALEALSGYGAWLHGEAVAVGMMVAGQLSNHLRLVDARTTERQAALLSAVGLPTRFEAPAPRVVWDALRHDKKAREGRVPFVLLKALGRAEVCFDVPAEMVLRALEEVHRGHVPGCGH
jgi:3-dehydroquinate synthase